MVERREKAETLRKMGTGDRIACRSKGRYKKYRGVKLSGKSQIFPFFSREVIKKKLRKNRLKK